MMTTPRRLRPPSASAIVVGDGQRDDRHRANRHGERQEDAFERPPHNEADGNQQTTMTSPTTNPRPGVAQGHAQRIEYHAAIGAGLGATVVAVAARARAARQGCCLRTNRRSKTFRNPYRIDQRPGHGAKRASATADHGARGWWPRLRWGSAVDEARPPPPAAAAGDGPTSRSSAPTG